MKVLHLGFFLFFCIINSHIAFGQTVFRGTVLDAETKEPISVAKVGIKGQGVGEITDEDGRFLYRKYHQVIEGSHIFEVSATDYVTLEMPGEEIRTLLNKSSTIYLDRYTAGVEKLTPSVQRILVLWDASALSRLRSPDKELALLLSFLKEANIAEIQLFIFNETIQDNKVINVRQGSHEIEKIISQIQYAGASDYTLIETLEADQVFLFAEKRPTFGELKVDQNTPVYSINSNPDPSKDLYFEKLSAYTSGNYLNLSRITLKTAIEALHSGQLPLIDKNNLPSTPIKGMITSTNGPVHYATITKEGDLKETYSKADGSFEISALAGDVLTISYLSMENQKVTIKDQEVLSIHLKQKNNVLDEVVVSAKKKKQLQQGYDPNTRIEYINKRPLEVRNVLTKNQINREAFSIFDVIRNRFTGVKLSFDHGLQEFSALYRDWPVGFIVNGQVVHRPETINVKSIERMSLYASVTNRQGQMFIITTRYHPSFEDEIRAKNDILIKGNYYKEAIPNLKFNYEGSDYLSEIKDISSTEKKFLEYERMRDDFVTQVDFYVDMALYFQNIDADIARKVRSDFGAVARDNPRALRILAYLNEHAGTYLMAQKIYTRILRLAPNEAQSYRDLALIYQETGEFEKSLELYINMLGNTIVGIDFTPLEAEIGNELQHLIMLHKNKVDFKRLPNDWLKADFDIDIRMTIAWSNPDAPFEFQFVNPKNRYYNWQSNANGQSPNVRRIPTKEFIIDDAPKGKWIVNVRYTGDELSSVVPPYLKYTLYKNYGQHNETKIVKLFRVDDQLEKVTLDTFLN